MKRQKRRCRRSCRCGWGRPRTPGKGLRGVVLKRDEYGARPIERHSRSVWAVGCDRACDPCLAMTELAQGSDEHDAAPKPQGNTIGKIYWLRPRIAEKRTFSLLHRSSDYPTRQLRSTNSSCKRGWPSFNHELYGVFGVQLGLVVVGNHAKLQYVFPGFDSIEGSLIAFEHAH